MKTINMKYGKSTINVSVSEKNLLGIIESNNLNKNETEEEIILKALDNPIESSKLKGIVDIGDKVCIVISDITRAWQKMGLYLPYIVEELKKGDIKEEDIIFLCATGTHRKQTKEEHEILLGEKLSKRFKVIDHDCMDKDNMIYLGKTSFGTPVSINKIALECDHIIITGAVVYHDMAGWGGGRKSILPGISSYESIMANHALALNKTIGEGSNLAVRCGNVATNPIHQDMIEAANIVKPSYLFNVIIDDKGDIVDAVAGNYIKAHEMGQKIVDKIDGVTIKEKADLVIASSGGYPKDINLYQATKTLSNAKEACKEDGTIIILSECIEGVGNVDLKTIIQDYENNVDREKAVRENFTVAKYIGYNMAEASEHFKIIFVSNIDKNIFKNINIQVVSTIYEALEITYKENGRELKTYFMPYGANTFPKLSHRNI